jgi:hypothetical protein
VRIDKREIVSTMYYINGDIYTDLDEPLRLARKRMEVNGKLMRVWKQDRAVLLATYRTSNDWGTPHTDKLPFEEVWPVFEAYVRML